MKRHEIRALGGSGSGNFGHAGRKGKRGGSAPGKGGGVVQGSYDPDSTLKGLGFTKNSLGRYRKTAPHPSPTGKGLKVTALVYSDYEWSGKGKNRTVKTIWKGSVDSFGMGTSRKSSTDAKEVIDWTEKAFNTRAAGGIS